MKWDMHYLVADIARTITLYPGDVLLSPAPRPTPGRCSPVTWSRWRSRASGIAS